MSNSSGSKRMRPRRRWASALVAILVAASLQAVVLVVAPNASATDPSQVNFTLEGCRNDGSITLPIAGKFICPDAAYTTGNLGKGWNELDLVPFRLTSSAGNSAPATQTFTVSVALDAMNSGHPGYDVLSTLTLNTALSNASCTAPVVGPQSTLTPGIGGIDQSIYRLVTITQAKNTDCVYDFYGRLALGSHLFPGSSLHANRANEQVSTQGIGGQDVSIPVKEISPQELSKDMTATQGSDHVWNVVKEPTPATLSFTNTCDPNAPLSQGVDIKVTWTKQPATPTGPITVVTHVYATNPASRAITTNVTDVIRTGSTVLDTTSAGPVDVPANTSQLILTHTTTVPAGTTNLNDIATGTYSDAVTGIAIPGSTTATASATVQPSGVESNQSATITDVESITGTGLSYSVDSFSGASGAFDNAYVAGTHTTGAVSWTSTAQSGSGSVTLHKTVYASAATVASGALSDTAFLTGSSGFSTQASASVTLSTNASTSLSVSKTTNQQIATAQTFTFHLYDANTNTATGDTATAIVPALSNGPVSSTVVSGLSPVGAYYFKEDAQAPYPAQQTSTVTFSLTTGDPSTCSATLLVSNQAAPATAQVRKDTVPASSGLWTFVLTGPGGLSESLTNVQAGAGYVPFTSSLTSDNGVYTITETPQTGYDLTNIVGDVGGNAGRVTVDNNALTCSFTLNLSTDSGKTFECAFTNTKRGHIIVKKVTQPSGSVQSFSFTPSWGAQFSLMDGQSNDSGPLVPGAYSVSETAVTGWDLKSATCDDGDSPASITLAAGQTITCTFTNVQRGHIIVKKVTQPSGSVQSFTFNPSWGSQFSLTDGQSNDSGVLVPGSGYSVSETATTGWDLKSATCDNGNSPSAITLQPGATVTCTFTNVQRGHAKVVKTVNNAALTGAQSFTFELRSGASAASAGTILETLVANAGNGGTITFATNLVPGQTYQLCEQMMPGWMTSLGPPFFAVYNPSGDNSVVCTDFTVTAGETKVFNIDNTPPPGGRALTIGFWKNWSSCTGGKQKPTLDQTLLAMANAGKPETLGTLVLDPKVLGASTACKDAVNLLNKSTLNGKKMSSDPLFNMTAQLLAADLNVAAGAGTCASAVTAINQAHALLSKYGFDGNGYSPKLSPSDAALANQLATTLDKYNNNLLC